MQTSRSVIAAPARRAVATQGRAGASAFSRGWRISGCLGLCLIHTWSAAGTTVGPLALDASNLQLPAPLWAVNAPALKPAAKSAQPGAARIAEFDPLVPDADFGAPVPVSQTQYIITGPAGLKPLQVYNDAQNTHIALADQLDRPSVLVPARGALQPHQSWVRGSQMLVRGVPTEIVLAYPDGRFISISRVLDPSLQARLAASSSLPAGRPSAPAASSASVPLGSSLGQIERERIEKQQQQQLQLAMLNDQLRISQIRIQELQEQALTEQTQKIRAQASQQEAMAQMTEAMAQMRELQLRLAGQAQSGPSGTQTAQAAGTAVVQVAVNQQIQPTNSPVAAADASGWILQNGETVSGALSRWAAASGRRLVWSPKVDVPIRRTKQYGGTLESALQQLAQDLSKTMSIVVQIEPQLILVGNAP